MTTNDVTIRVGSHDTSQASLDDLKRKLNDLGRMHEKASVDLSGKAAYDADKLKVQLDALGRKTAKPNISLAGIAKAELDMQKIRLDLDKLGQKNTTVWVTIKQRTSSLSGSIGGAAALGLAPSLIPLGGAVLGAAAGVGASLGALAAPLGIFAAMAKTIFTEQVKQNKNLQTSNADLAKAEIRYQDATTKSAKDAAAKKIAALKQVIGQESEQADAYGKFVSLAGQIDQNWRTLSEQIAAPALVPWLDAVNKLMVVIQPLVQPIADEFQSWGEQVDRLVSGNGVNYFIKLAGELGKFAALQLDHIVGFFINVGKGIGTLAQLLAGHNVDFDAFGQHLDTWGKAFDGWAQSDSARKTVNNFLTYLHDNGPVIKKILGDLAGILPKLFTGLSSAGAIELKAISTFLTYVNSLPPSVSKPLFDIAGALLILNKLGVVKVGLSVSATLGGALAKTAFGEALLGGAASFLLPVVLVAAALIGLDKIHVLTPKNSDLGFNGAWAKNIEHWWDVAANDIGNVQDRIQNDVDRKADQLRHDLSGIFAGIRHDISGYWDDIYNNTIGVVIRFGHDVEAKLNSARHSIAVIFDGVRGDISNAWNSALSWMKQLPGKISSIFNGSGNWLYNHGRDIIDGLWNGIKNIWNGLLSWLRRLPGTISSVFNGSGNWLVAHGRNIADGLYNGIRDGIGSAWNWVKAHIYNPIVNAVKGLFGIKSPSTVFAALGGHVVSGFLKGILSGKSGISSVIGHVFGGGTKALGDLVKKGIIGIEKLPAKALGALGKLGGALGSFFSKLVGNGGSGVARWKGIVDQALRLNGLSTSLDSQVLRQISSESGGNPNAINNSDSNAAAGDPSRGLLQTIGSTFAAYHVSGTSNNIFDPLANVAAAINYAKARYGQGLMNSSGEGLGSGHGYATGGPASGWAMVGEHGRELVRLPTGSQVYPNAATEGAQGSGGQVTVEISGSGSSTFDAMMLQWVRSNVRVKGGGNVQRAFGAT